MQYYRNKKFVNRKIFLAFQIFLFSKKFPEKISKIFFIAQKILKIFPARHHENNSQTSPQYYGRAPIETPSLTPHFPVPDQRQSGLYMGSDVRLFPNGALCSPGSGSTNPLFDAIHLEVFCMLRVIRLETGEEPERFFDL